MKKYIPLIIIICVFSLKINAQVWEKKTNNYYSSPYEKNINFKNYKKEKKYKNKNGFNPYERELNFLLERSSKERSFMPDALYVEWEKERRKKKKYSSSSNWIAKGPVNTPIILTNGKKRGNGRINCIAFDPINPNIIWVGSPSGGLWKSDNGGAGWTTATDNLPVIGVSHIAINPSNSQIMYIVTGDGYASDTYPIGVLKSIDGGLNWSTTGLSYDVAQEKRINKIILNPNYPDSIFAATNDNIMLSVDGGNSWTSTGMIGRWRDIEFKPGSPRVIYAAKHAFGGSNVYRSTDGGANWSVINNGVSSSGKDRPLIAVTPANPNVIYALFSAGDDSYHGLYKSIDSGDNWSLQSNSPNILGREVDGTGAGGQSWYDLSLGVSTNDESLVYVGGINLWKSNNSGLDWQIDGNSGNNQQLYSYMHVDQHAMEFNPLTDIAYAGNDGGIYTYSESLNRWVDISDGLEISQFYKLGVSQSNQNRVVAGAQDNGTEMLTNTTWDAIRGADGMECAIDQFDEDIIYSTSQYGGLKKSYDGGFSWSNIKPVSYSGGWVTPYKIHPNNNNLIVIGYDEIYRSTSGGSAWDSISYNVSGGQSLKSIALAPSNENYIYAATYSTIKVTTDAGNTWTSIKAGLPNYNITDIAVSDINPDHLWVTFSEYSASHKVYESTDRGATWVNITSNNLPNLPINCIVHQSFSNNDLYIGTDIGVYYKNNNMTDWTPYMNGLPNVIVKELEIQYDEGTINAATYGRGIWESPLNNLPSEITNSIKTPFVIYPNPAKETLHFKIPAYHNSYITIYDMAGKKHMERVLSSKKGSINIANLNTGCYFVEFNNDLAEITRKKLIITK